MSSHVPGIIFILDFFWHSLTAFDYVKIFRNFGWEISGQLWSGWKFSGLSGSPSEVVLFDQSVRSNKKLAFPFPKIRICNPTLLSSHQSFGQNRNGSLQFDWRPCFNWTMSFHFFLIIPLVSIWLVFQNGKHQLCLKSSVQQIPCQDSSWIYHGSVEYCIQSLSLRFARISSTELWLIFLISPGPSSSPQEAGFVEHLEMFSLN